MPNAVESLFPGIFCLEDIQCISGYTGGVNYRATLYHDRACITVSFNGAECDQNLENGKFVSVRWLPDMHSDHGAIQVAGLTVQSGSTRNLNLKNFNPFLTVPHTWNVDRHLINYARDLWSISSKAKRQLLFAVVVAQAAKR